MVCRALVLPDPSELPKKEDGGGWGGELKVHAARAEDLLKVPEHLFEEECEEALRSEDWLVFSSGLWFRCKAEAHRSKTVERACLQLHALGDQSMGKFVRERRKKCFTPRLQPLLSWTDGVRRWFQISTLPPVTAWDSFSPSTIRASGS